MRLRDRWERRVRIWTCLGLATLGASACETMQGNITLGVVAATILGGQAPDKEIEQIYYLGVFDPQEQLPPTVYRLRVHGQASFYSQTKFASGWVRADMIDSLNTTIEFDKNGNGLIFKKASEEERVNLQTGRKLILFGPEGFREAPKDHRLVVVMGANPEGFFKAIDSSLEVFTDAISDKQDAALNRKLYESLVLMKAERERLADVAKDIDADLPAKPAAKP